VVAEFHKRSATEIHLLNIQPPFSRHVAQFASRRNRAAYHREQGERALEPARRLLEQAGVPHTTHIELGEKAQVIAREARRLRCDRIVMATARKNSLTRMIEDSVTNEVLELTTVPVEVIAGDAVSKWERYGIPAGIGLAFALVYAAFE
jgi:nucleotide-binding universal stress UspA family protein